MKKILVVGDYSIICVKGILAAIGDEEITIVKEITEADVDCLLQNMRISNEFKDDTCKLINSCDVPEHKIKKPHKDKYYQRYCKRSKW